MCVQVSCTTLVVHSSDYTHVYWSMAAQICWVSNKNKK